MNLRNTCRRNLTQRLVSWYNPVVPKVCIETRTWVAKGLKMGRTEVIQTGVVCFQSYQCLYVCGWGTWEKSRLVTLRLTVKITHTIIIFSYVAWGLGRCLTRFHQTQIWVVLKKFENCWSNHSSVSGWRFFKIHECLNSKIASTGKKFNFFHFSHTPFIDETDCKLSVSNGSVIVLSTYKIKKPLSALDFAAESSRCNWMISNLLWDRVATFS